MKKDFLWIGIIVGIIGLVVCLFIANGGSTTPNNEIENPSTSIDVSDPTTESTNPTDTTTPPTVESKPADPTESTDNTLPDTQNPSETTDKKCEHKDKKTEIIQEASCTAEGIKKMVCKDCNIVIEEITTEKLMHNYSNITKEATCEEIGENYNLCSVCGHKKILQTFPALGHTEKNIIVTERTCTSRGEIQTVCEKCQKVLDTQYSPQYNHQWIYYSEVFATPVKDGSITYQCFHCETEKTETEPFVQNGTINICIPSVRLNKEVIFAECNQTNTDKYDISCDMNYINEKNPLFFGHNTQSLGRLSSLKVGDLIYFTVNGKTTTYKVTISEEGTLIDGGKNIQGNTSGELCISPREKETLHFFTCYNALTNPNSRWIVLAEKV